ncbi:hypothetical protein QE402_005163 [Klebsiella sp. SORGH_AS 1025]|nr:hypothetical protein [Klebsiella sp. RC2]MDR6249553.1 hypothetical protein [Klebsiella variicola]MDR6260719.1 hypothetical protein [Klebsiella sp. SORGH_AS_0826]MDR6348178.1 hypothetical protein [Klebsiella sp. SORGH_AS_1025]MDR6363142.1 hypothetical protein [Klebsiella sp. SORGH_AS_1173]
MCSLIVQSLLRAGKVLSALPTPMAELSVG